MANARSLAAAVAVAVLMVVWTAAEDEIPKDLLDCAETLTSLQTCMPFVSAKSNVPTKDCCKKLDVVVEEKPKCLCVLIEYHNATVLDSYDIDLDRAIRLPTVCNNDKADINRCPELLGLDPNSTEAKIFKEHAAKVNPTNSGGSPLRDSGKTTTSESAAGGSRYHAAVWACYCLASLILLL